MNLIDQEFLKYMSRFDDCPFTLVLHGEAHQIGEGEPAFSVVIRQAPKVRELMTSTSLALGEAYMDGDIQVEGDLYPALQSFMGQMGKFSTDTHALARLLFSSVSKKNQKKEVCSHYNIGNDFYRLWLDETLSYSCAYFRTEEDSLYTAQCQKADRILRKLYLKEGMTLCDIGCGWGFLLLRAARQYGIRGVGITLSEEQRDAFDARIREEQLQDRLRVELLDYRDLKTLELSFDRIVSVGMAEHVGRENYIPFMEQVRQSLKPGGLFLLHFISALQEHPGDAWIKKYIFPGGVIPSLREMLQIAGELQFYTLDVESLRRHYSRTLLCWNENFQKHREEITEMFDERFARMWELYLCSCAATFMDGIIDLHQVLFSRGVNNELPMTRWY